MHVRLFVWSPGAWQRGFFDGVGRTLKNKSHSLVQATKTSREGIAGTENGYIQSPKDVHAVLKHYFETDYSATRRKHGKNQINKFKFFEFMTDVNPIWRTEETFTPLENISSCYYQFVVGNAGIVNSRKRLCWCMKCTSVTINGSVSWGYNHRVSRCTSS